MNSPIERSSANGLGCYSVRIDHGGRVLIADIFDDETADELRKETGFGAINHEPVNDLHGYLRESIAIRIASDHAMSINRDRKLSVMRAVS